MEAVKPLTQEALALTEKKMSMSLDDIINMSKTNENKGRKQRVWNHNQKFSNNVSHDKNAKARRFMSNRSPMRQGALAERRTNFQSNQFPLATEAAKTAAAAPIHNRAFNQRRAVNVNKQRVTPSPFQKKASYGGSCMTQQNSHYEAKPAPLKQKPQTLDSLFANMQEQRLKSISQQNSGPRSYRGGQQSIVPWARRHFVS